MERYEVDELLKLTPEEQIQHDKYVNGIKNKMKIFGFLYKNFIGLSILSLISMNIIGIYLLLFLVGIFSVLSLLSYMKYNDFRSRFIKANMTNEDYYNLLKSLEDPDFDPIKESDDFIKDKLKKEDY
jgi:hypothetical protein